MVEKIDNEGESRLVQRNFSAAQLLVVGLVAVLFTIAITNMIAPVNPTGKVVYVPQEVETNETNETTDTTIVSAEEVSELATTLIKDELVPAGVEVIVTEVAEEGDLYRLTIGLTQNGQTNELYSYMSKDGQYFYPSVFDLETNTFLEQKPEVETTPTEQPVPPSFDAPDAEVPNVKFFVMSFCPFGLQAEQGLKPVYDLMGDKVELEPHYVIYENYGGGGPDYCIEDGKYCSMHGIKELNENARQLCIYKNEDRDTFWNYLETVWTDCTLNDIDTCWKTAAEKNGIDVASVETCFENERTDLIKAEFEACQEFDVRGSPAVFVNDEKYSGGRAPDNYKEGICSGFTTIPGECDTELDNGSTGANGNC
ncbi:hypothetical protein K8R43_03595 [archaeon]|nr:hypothetical protein [archaeon]